MTLARGITNYARFVVGYHGCDEQLSHDVLLGKKGMEESTNDYDWLGRGIYFWEQGARTGVPIRGRRGKTKLCQDQNSCRLRNLHLFG